MFIKLTKNCLQKLLYSERIIRQHRKNHFTFYSLFEYRAACCVGSMPEEVADALAIS